MSQQNDVKSSKQPWWKAWGPSAMIAAAIVGPGTITTVSVAGAEHGYKVAWILIVACLIGYMLNRPVITWTMATGTSMLEGIRKELSSLWARILFIGLWIGALVFQAGNFAGAGMALEFLAPSVSMTFWIALLSLMALVIAWIGVYKLIENINRVVIVLLVIAFCVTALTAVPDVDGLMAKGFSFRVPGNDFWLVLALVGTVLVPNQFFSLSGFAKHKYKHEPELKTHEKIRRSFLDLKVNFLMMALITVAILVSAATAIYGTGITIEDAGDMAMQLTPILGKFAGVFFALGLFTAGFSSGLFNLTVQPMLFGQAFNMSEAHTSWLNRGLLLITAAVPVILAGFFGGAPVELIVTAQALNGLLLPLITATILILSNKKKQMGIYKNSVLNNVVLGIIMIIVTLLTIQVFIDM